jgi:hypothetical protein
MGEFFLPPKSYQNSMGEKMPKEKFSRKTTAIWNKLFCELLYGINNPNQ